MKNLQDLYDTYIETRPSAGKVKTATYMLIHVCKALEISSQEEVTSEYFESIPQALESFFHAYPLKATLDKTMLAEMIGRVGPKKSVKNLLEKLLTDENENVRQFSLNCLEYYGIKNPSSILPYIEKYLNSNDEEMLVTAAMLVGNIQCSDQHEMILEKIKKWYKNGDITFVREVIKRMILLRRQKKCDQNKYMDLDQLEVWLNENCHDIAEVVLET
jgi:HEAT repeat protein